MPDNKRIAKNTLLLYLRMTIVMIVNLYAVRVVLNALGSVDYGVFTVVAGVVTMLSCVTTVLTTATQRYYSYALGENNSNALRDIFSASIHISVIVAVLIIVLGETLGLWFINTYLVIPDNRINAANWLYQATIISFISVFLQTPYNAAIIAHEKMGIYAAISTVECFLKLGAALMLKLFIGDKLILYGILLSLISLLSLGAYMIIGHRKFSECYYHRVRDKKLMKELLSFSGWNFVGSFAGVGMHYVNTILVNIFFGPIVNTAQAIAFQISSALNSFSGSFIMAVRPPMIKSYAEKNFVYLNRLFGVSNKFTYYCMLVVCIPLISEMGTIIHYWLGVDDAQTILFCRLIVVYSFILVMNNPISIIMQATGYVKRYFVTVESFTLLCPIITYVLFKLGLPAYSSFIAMIGCIIGSHIIRLVILKKYYSIAVLPEYINFITRALFVTISVVLVIFYIRQFMVENIERLIVVIGVTVVLTFVLAYLFGINKVERNLIHQIAGKILYHR